MSQKDGHQNTQKNFHNTCGLKRLILVFQRKIGKVLQRMVVVIQAGGRIDTTRTAKPR
jgi:hypothetical protein